MSKTPTQRIEYRGEPPFKAQICSSLSTEGKWIAYVLFQDFRFNISPGSRPWTIGFSHQDKIDLDSAFERAVRYHEELVGLMKAAVTNLKVEAPPKDTVSEQTRTEFDGK